LVSDSRLGSPCNNEKFCLSEDPILADSRQGRLYQDAEARGSEKELILIKKFETQK